MTNTKSYRVKSLLIAFLAVALVLSILPVSVFAVTDQDTPSFSVSVSNENPQAGELVTVTVQIDNCNSIRYYIGAMQMQLNYNTALFVLVENSGIKASSFDTSGDVAELGYDLDEGNIRFGYVMAGSSRGLSRQTTELFSVTFQVNKELSSDASAEFSLTDVLVYSTDNAETALPTHVKNKTVNVWENRPPILLNGSATNRGRYESAVTVTFDAPSARLIYNGGADQIIQSGYKAEMNGSYTVTVDADGTPYSVTFTIARTIRRISVKTGTLATSYPLGVTPSYSNGILLIEYTDGTYSEISLTAPGVSVTGFDPEQIGNQQLTITYEGFITNVTVTVQNKTVQNIELKTPYPKTTYLEGTPFDVTGGVIQVTYQDYTMEDVPLSMEMISGFDPALVGTQTIKITYGTAETTLTVEVVSRAAVDDLIAKIAEIDLRTLDPNSAEDKERIRTLAETYNNMSAVEQAGVVNLGTLLQAIEIVKGDPAGGETTDNNGTQQGGEQQQGKNGNKVWLIVLIIIVVLSVAGGAAYFIIAYLKKKREDEEYYYDDDEEDDEDEDEFLDDEYEDEEEYDDDEE